MAKKNVRRNVTAAKTYRYTVVLESDAGGGFHVFCPSLPGCHSEGDTEREALANIREAMELYIETLIEDGEEIPPDTTLKTARAAVTIAGGKQAA